MGHLLRALPVLPSIASLVLAGCLSDDIPSRADRMGGSGAQAAEADTPRAWTTLIDTRWMKEPGAEQLWEEPFVADRDYTITAIRPVASPGTHHVGLLGAGAPHNLLFTAPTGAGEFVFPTGVGLRVRKGDAMALDLHVLNVTTQPLEGVSGLEIEESDSAEVHEANVLTAAQLSLSLPPGRSSASAICTLTYDQTIFAVAPHMHALGVHLRTTLVRPSGTLVLYDQAFDFDRQAYTSIAPLAAKAGDKIVVECTWENTTGRTVEWGTAAVAEMCQSMLYRYPAGDGNFCDQ